MDVGTGLVVGGAIQGILGLGGSKKGGGGGSAPIMMMPSQPQTSSVVIPPMPQMPILPDLPDATYVAPEDYRAEALKDNNSEIRTEARKKGRASTIATSPLVWGEDPPVKKVQLLGR